MAPSLLLCDFGHLADEVHRLEAAGVKALHLDVMDGHFVPNMTYGLPIVEAVRRVTQLPIEAHLMISDPARYAEQFFAAGADAITFHVEAIADPRPLLDELHALGAAAGLAYNPDTPVSAIRDYVNALRPGAHDERRARVWRPGVPPRGARKSAPAQGHGGPRGAAGGRRRSERRDDRRVCGGRGPTVRRGLGHFQDIRITNRRSPRFPVPPRPIRGRNKTMVQIVLIRPGSTDYDEQGRIQGTLDIPLSEQGTDEVERVIEEIRKLGIEAIYCCPCQSACQTATRNCRGIRLESEEAGHFTQY